MRWTEVLLGLFLATATLAGIFAFIHFLFPHFILGTNEKENVPDDKPLWNRLEKEDTIKDIVFTSKVAEDLEPVAIRKHGYPFWMSVHGKEFWLRNNIKELTNIGEEIYLRLKVMEGTTDNENGSEYQDKLCLGFPLTSIMPNRCGLLGEIVPVEKKSQPAIQHTEEVAPKWLTHRYQGMWKDRKFSVSGLRKMLGAIIRKINASKQG